MDRAAVCQNMRPTNTPNPVNIARIPSNVIDSGLLESPSHCLPGYTDVLYTPHTPHSQRYPPYQRTPLGFNASNLLQDQYYSSIQLTPSQTPSKPEKNYQVVIDNELIKFKRGDIPPPAGKVVFKNDIELLVQYWDKGNANIVQYDGKPIPLRKWREVFIKAYPSFWSTYSKSFSEQKVYITGDILKS
jgi:hypothetical protein